MAKKKKLKGTNIIQVPAVPKKNAITADEGLLRFRVNEDLGNVEVQIASCYNDSGTMKALRLNPAVTLEGDDFTSLATEIEALTDKIWDILKANGDADF